MKSKWCCCSVARLFQLSATPWTASHQASLSITICQSLLRLTPIELVMPFTISSSVTLFSFCLQSIPASGSFPVRQLFASGGQSIGASGSASVLPMNIQGWFPLGLTVLITLQYKGLSRVFSSTTVWKHQFFGTQPSLWSNPHIQTWLLEKVIALIIWTFVGKIMSLLFNTLSRLVIAFLPRSKCYLILWLAAVTICSDFGAQENKTCHCFYSFHIYLPWNDGTRCHDLSFLNVEF